MNVSSAKINESLLRLKTDIFGNYFPRKHIGGEPPLRSELFSADQMEQHGKTLPAHTHWYPGMLRMNIFLHGWLKMKLYCWKYTILYLKQ